MSIVTAPTATLDQENFFAATLAANIAAGDLTISLDQVPTTVTEGYLVISRKSSTLREVIYFTSVDTVLKTVTCPATGGRGIAGSAQSHTAGESVAMTNNAEYWQALKQGLGYLDGVINHRENLVKNSNFHNNSSNGYGGTPDDWTNSSANPVQGGFPILTKQALIDLLGVTDGEIEGLWSLNNVYTDLSANGYTLSAAGSPVFSDDGLMGKALDLEAGSSQYASIADASCPALEISGSQTFIAFIKPESVGTDYMQILSKTGATNAHQLYVNNTSTGKQVVFKLSGLTTNETVTSDVVLQAGKWYMIVGVYDSANTLLKVWVNGVLKQVTASGSAADTNGNFAVGADTQGSIQFFDGLVQNAAILSTALTNAQVKRLWAATTWKGIKLRRSGGTDGYIYQDLPEDMVVALRGKKLTARASVTQDTASIAKITIDDGSTTSSDVFSSAVAATTGVYTDVKVTKTISSTATRIRIKLEVVTSNGSAWFKDIAMYQGAIMLPWQPAADDWNRFPRLLQLNPAYLVSAYEYEENRWYSYTTKWGGFSVDPTGTWKYLHRGTVGMVKHADASGGTSNATSFTWSLPFTAKSGANNAAGGPCFVTDNGSNSTTLGHYTLPNSGVTVNVYRQFFQTGWTGSGSKEAYPGTVVVELD